MSYAGAYAWRAVGEGLQNIGRQITERRSEKEAEEVRLSEEQERLERQAFKDRFWAAQHGGGEGPRPSIVSGGGVMSIDRPVEGPRLPSQLPPQIELGVPEPGITGSAGPSMSSLLAPPMDLDTGPTPDTEPWRVPSGIPEPAPMPIVELPGGGGPVADPRYLKGPGDNFFEHPKIYEQKKRDREELEAATERQRVADLAAAKEKRMRDLYAGLDMSPAEAAVRAAGGTVPTGVAPTFQQAMATIEKRYGIYEDEKGERYIDPLGYTLPYEQMAALAREFATTGVMPLDPRVHGTPILTGPQPTRKPNLAGIGRMVQGASELQAPSDTLRLGGRAPDRTAPIGSTTADSLAVRVSRARAAGRSDDTIAAIFKEMGFSDDEIRQAFQQGL